MRITSRTPLLGTLSHIRFAGLSDVKTKLDPFAEDSLPDFGNLTGTADLITARKTTFTGAIPDAAPALQSSPVLDAKDVQVVHVPHKRWGPQEQEDYDKYMMRATMPGFGKQASKSRNKASTKTSDLSDPLLNAGITNGLHSVQELASAEVYALRNSGTPIPGTKMKHTDAIELSTGFDRQLFFALGPKEIAANLDRLQPHVRAAAQAHDVDINLINAVITRESKGMQNAISPTGALGPSQLTYWVYGPSKALGEGINPFAPDEAIERQAKYLSQLSRTYDGDLDRMVAAYNQGQTSVDRAIKNHGAEWINHIDSEGKNYVKHINNIMQGKFNIPGYFGTEK